MIGFKIDGFTVGSAGAQAGLFLEDVITHVNGVEHDSIESLVSAVGSAGGSFKISYIRGDTSGILTAQGDSLGCKLSAAVVSRLPL